MAEVERGWIVAPTDDDVRLGGYSWLEFPLELDDESDWPPVRREAVWAHRLTEDLYRIDTVPYFAADIAVDDVVKAGPGLDGKLEFSEKVSAGGRSTVRIIFSDYESPERDDVISKIAYIVGAVRYSPWPSLIAVDVPTLDQLFRLHQLLGPYREHDVLGYEDASVPVEYWDAHPELT